MQGVSRCCFGWRKKYLGQTERKNIRHDLKERNPDLSHSAGTMRVELIKITFLARRRLFEAISYSAQRLNDMGTTVAHLKLRQINRIGAGPSITGEQPEEVISTASMSATARRIFMPAL